MDWPWFLYILILGSYYTKKCNNTLHCWPTASLLCFIECSRRVLYRIWLLYYHRKYLRKSEKCTISLSWAMIRSILVDFWCMRMWVNTVKENCMYKKDKKINQKSLKSFPVLWMSYPAEQNRIWLLATLEKIEIKN